jgi:hypothetical protein
MRKCSNTCTIGFSTNKKPNAKNLKNNEDNENVLYYLSRMLNGVELYHSLIEKTCLTLIFVVKKLMHYLRTHLVRLIFIKIDI